MATTTQAPSLTSVPSMFRLAANSLRPPPVTKQRLAWLATARIKQLPPPGIEWDVWFILAGRGFGKTRSGAEHTAQFARDNPGAEIGVIGRTDAEARRLLLNGPSGLLAVLDPSEIARCVQSPGDTVLELTNGSTIYVTGANSPDSLRGLNLWMAWCDELASWRYQQVIWDEVLEPAVRIGPHPHMLVTTTPRPTKLVRTLLKEVGTRVVRGSTFDNAANLAGKFITRMQRKYDVDPATGLARTRAGRQEINAEVLDDVPGALVTRAVLDASRVQQRFDDDGVLYLPGAKLDGLYRQAVVALDPADGVAEGDEQGIALVGLGWDHELYIEQVDGVKMAVTEYLGTALDLAVLHHATLVVEKNHGSAYLVATLDQVMREKGVTVPVRIVRAADGKRTRAEPIVPLFERNKLHFIGDHPEVEDQLTSWVGAAGEKSPDRLDALVWAVTHFLGHALKADDPDDGDDGGYAYEQGDPDTWAADHDGGLSYGYG